MKKNGWTLLLFAVLGLLAGALADRWLKEVPSLAALTRSAKLDWKPSADLGLLSYKLELTLNFSVVSLACLVLAFWLYRKL
ncbi:DUF4321 domain-containing protein [Paenibacillus pasadenensis]|uniref:DUF4321 domain-containing protein n=1 Tax=Paenibacillus pasadenensis TaxID=217090 RepID=UPI00203F4400|nr:DUF4321 domain-containing protein [Paenibacillus pasadenensis]MCM3746718.1 DUF4321 domain-containing protein [Paenibacillus pasadenensis]